MKLRHALLACAAGLALAAGSAAAQDLKFPIDGDARFNWQSYHEFADKYDLTGQDFAIFTPWVAADGELVESMLAYFAAATGANVQHTGSDSFEQQIVIDTQAGSPANIAVFPQPGLTADIAAKGYLSPLDDATKQWIVDNYGAGQSWVDLSTYKDKDGNAQLFAFPYKADLKSLVWYVPENFEDAGYEVPTTMEELQALTEKIVADGGTPWCIGIGSQAATGWPATDWVEDMMLRTQPPEVYDQWVKNEIPFDDPKVVAAIDEFGWFAKNDTFVDGGAAAVAATDFRDSPKGLFSSPPKCYMHRQASFIPSFFPEGTKLGEDANFFYFPAYSNKDLGRPVLGGGTLFAITKDSPAARAFIEWLKTPIAHEVWMAQSGFLTPFKGVNLEAYGNDTLRGEGKILSEATTFRFDGSDLMPGKIGAGSFWTGMVDYVGGKDASAVATDVQTSWDAIK
jgi:alpha-glucoside transport system substrate-binding protein